MCIRDRLSVKKFDEKVIERMGKKIFKLHNNGEDSLDEIVSNTFKSTTIENLRFKKAKNVLLKYLKPKLKVQDYLSYNIKSIVAIKLSYYQFCYVHLDKVTNTILDWNSSECLELKESTQHPKLHETALRIVREIPPADLYIIEEQQFQPKAKINSNIDYEGILTKITYIVKVKIRQFEW